MLALLSLLAAAAPPECATATEISPDAYGAIDLVGNDTYCYEIDTVESAHLRVSGNGVLYVYVDPVVVATELAGLDVVDGAVVHVVGTEDLPDFFRIAIEDSEHASIQVLGEGSQLYLTDVTARGSLTGFGLNRHGGAVAVEEGAILEMTRGARCPTEWPSMAEAPTSMPHPAPASSARSSSTTTWDPSTY